MPEPAQGEPSQTASIPVAAVEITPIPRRIVLRLKSWRQESVHGGKPLEIAGHVLPSRVGETSIEPLHILCVGPGEWLIISAEHGALSLRERFDSCLQDHELALVELTDGLASLDVRGSASRELLSKGCGLDLHPRHFPPGHCARTRLAQLAVVMDCLEDPSRFELTVARSYFRYLHSWLTDAALEFQGSSK